MSYYRVYISPAIPNPEIPVVLEVPLAPTLTWVEVTDDVTVDDLNDVRQIIDDNEYDVGIFKNSDFGLSLKNENGKYSPPGLKSIFTYLRGGSLVKITWTEQDSPALCGVFTAGEQIIPNDEIVIFTGLLNDDATTVDIKDQIAHFRVLGKESIFDIVETPFDLLSNGQTVQQVLQTVLNQFDIRILLTYVPGAINPDLNAVVDDVSGFQNTVVSDVIREMLQISNSVLILVDDVIYVQGRTPGSNVATFYGQASPRGLESIMDMTMIKTGLEKTFNYLTWTGTSIFSEDLDSTQTYGIRKKDLSITSITNPTTQQAILDAYLAEFSQPKESLLLLAPLTPAYLAIAQLDVVSIDYPIVYYNADGALIPIYGISKYGIAKYPIGVWSLKIDAAEEWKVMGRSIKTKNQQIEFTLRRV